MDIIPFLAKYNSTFELQKALQNYKAVKMIVLVTFLALGFIIFLVMCYIACYKGSITEEGDDFKQLPLTGITSAGTTEAMEMTENSNKRKRGNVAEYNIMLTP